MKKILIFAMVSCILLSSCATILNSKYQKIAINTGHKDEVLINQEAAKVKNGKYLFQRDLKPKQITIKSEGFKDENIVIMQYKKSPLHIMSWIPFTLLLYPPFYDKGPKSWDYDKNELTFIKTSTIQNKSTDSKEIKINKVSVELEKNNIKNRHFPSYKNYIRKENKKKEVTSDTEEDLNIENTVFSYALNDLLKEKGYIDTTRAVLKNSYLDNLLINAKVTGFTIHHVANRYYTKYGGMVYIELSINWEVLDYYNKPIYTKTTASKSGQFAILDYEKKEKVIINALKDGLEGSFIEFMKSDKVVDLLNDRSEIEKENAFEEISISQSSSYVKDLGQSIKSSLTIKTKAGFGSGFIISEDGYIVTNYHVVSDPTELKIILNDNSEYAAKIVRTSKIHDLALLKIDAKGLKPFPINSSKDIQIAAEVYAVGTPSAEDLSQTISRGIISGIRNTSNSKLIQTDASINSGNSGGPLVSKEGLVIAVVSSKLQGFGVEGVAFGIPAYEVLDKLKIKLE